MSHSTIPERFDAAPISRLPSSRLQIAAGYFTLSGIFGGAAVVARVALMAVTGTFGLGRTLAVATLTVSAIGLLWTGRALRAQRRVGWHAGLFALALPLVATAVSPTIRWLGFAVSVIGLAMLWSVRAELVD